MHPWACGIRNALFIARMKFSIAVLLCLAVFTLSGCERETEPVAVAVSNPASASQAKTDQPVQQVSSIASSELTLPQGFKAIVVAENLGRGRHIAVRDNGDIYVSLIREKEGQGAYVALRDEDGDGTADRVEYFGSRGGTGLEIFNGYLYAQRRDDIVRWKLPEGDDLVPTGEPEVIATGFIHQTTHEAKAIAFDGEGSMWVSVGAPSNACQEQARTPGSPGQMPCPQLERHAGVWRFDDSAPGQEQLDAEHFATGLRHCVAMEWNPVAKGLFALSHGRDQLGSLFPDRFTEQQNAELPSEEFHRLEAGSNAGWPYAYWDPARKQRMLAPEYGGNGRVVARENYQEPLYGFPAHWAPNDLLFYTAQQFPDRYRNGAFVAFHGSWNRAPKPQEGYHVAFLPMNAEGRPTGPHERFADGFAGVDTIENTRDARYRPCGLAQGPDGALYVIESNQGKIWKIAYTGE